MAAKLLHTVKQIFGYDRLLHIRNDLLLRYGVVDLLVNFEADRCAFEVYCAPGVRSYSGMVTESVLTIITAASLLKKESRKP